MSLKNDNRSPLSSYYGGKFRLAKHIITRIPPHKNYVEPFFGGGAVFFLKQKSKYEIINDLDNNLFTFWKVCKEKGNELHKKLHGIHHFQVEFFRAVRVVRGEEKPKDDVDHAYCVFLAVNQNYAGKITGNAFVVGHDKGLNSKIENISNLMYRFNKVFIFCQDALKIIKNKDSEDTFFYLDPPYPEAYQHYNKKYSMDDFNNLLNILSKIKGKFILSCYIKDKMNINPKWKTKIINVLTHVNDKPQQRKEAIIFNY